MQNILNIFNKRIVRITFFILFGLILQSIILYLIIQEVSLSEPNHFVNDVSSRVANDLKYNDGKWDTTAYNADPLTAYPNSSTQFPLYIITSEGFVIERSKPINGLLDTSDYKRILEFETPQNINTLTNEQWRVMSKPIKEGNIVGAILVAYYNPQTLLIDQIDQKLRENINNIDSQITIQNGDLDVSKLDVRNIHYDISFEVVTKYNKVIANNGRTPSFIDTSYIQNEINSKSQRIFRDSSTQEEFLVKNQILKDSNNNSVGLIVVGKSINSLNNTLNSFLVTSLISSIFLSLTIAYFLNRNKEKIEIKTEVFEEIKSISFNKKLSTLNINNKIFEIAKDTNQYYLLKSLFSNSKKKWANDELLEIFGEDLTSANSRKVYDAYLAVNKKVGIKLIDYKDKYYFINTDYTNCIE